jgi:tetratricopeptide (TPR) repeat protein
MPNLSTALILNSREDETIMLRYSLPLCGISPTVCDSVPEAIKILTSKSDFSYIFVDMQMRNNAPFMFLQLLSQHKTHALRAIPVIGFVGRVNRSELSNLAELGVFNMIPKPLNEKVITERLVKIVADYQNPNSAASLDLEFRKSLIKGEHTRALALAQKALGKNTQSVRLHVSLAVAQFHAKQDDIAMKSLQHLMPSLKDSLYLPYVLTLIAKIHIRKKDPQKALQFLEKAQGISPQSMERLLLISELLLATNKAAVAEQKFRTAMRFFPESTSMRVGLGKSLVAQGDIDGAKRLIQTIPSGRNKMLSHLNSLGVELSRSGKFQEAVKTYETALQIAENSKELSSIWYNIALAWSKSGHFAKATSACTRCIQAEPTHEKAKALLLKCGQEMATFVPHDSPKSKGNNETSAPQKEPANHTISCVSDELLDRIENGILEDALG